MPGRSSRAVPGLLSGMATTARTMTRPAHTRQYPDERPELPARSRGVIALVEQNCTSCMLCARECPDWCIHIDSHKETVPAGPEGGRPRQQNVLDRFAIDFGLCMYCGICIEVCPFDALFWTPHFEYASGDLRDLLHEKEQLAGWAQDVPPPQPLDPAAAPEAATVSRSGAAARPGRAGRARPGRPRPGADTAAGPALPPEEP